MTGKQIDDLVESAIQQTELLNDPRQQTAGLADKSSSGLNVTPPDAATSPNSISSSQMQTQIGSHTLPYTPSSVSPPYYGHPPYSPYGPSPGNQPGYYQQQNEPVYQYAYHNRYYAPHYQMPPPGQHDPALLYQMQRQQLQQYPNTMSQQQGNDYQQQSPPMQQYPVNQQMYWRPNVQYVGMPGDPSLASSTSSLPADYVQMDYRDPQNIVYDDQGNMYYPVSPDSAYGRNYSAASPYQPGSTISITPPHQLQQHQQQSSAGMAGYPYHPDASSTRHRMQPQQQMNPTLPSDYSNYAATSESAPSAPQSPSMRSLPELSRGYLAQANFHNAVYGRPPPLPHQYPEQPAARRTMPTVRNALPKPPPHSDFALWCGNVPSDATHSELWRFFNSRPSPMAAGVTEHPDVLAMTDPTNPPDLRSPGVESIHLIARSNCCFVNYASQVHLDQGLKASNGISLRPYDARIKDLVCRVRRKGDDSKTGVGAQRGVKMHQNWAQEHPRFTSDAPPNDQLPEVDGHAPEPHKVPRHRSSASTDNSAGTGSTSSSFLSTNFPKRYFVLKSLSEGDLELSVQNGLWATQSHNEPILDQAFRTSREGVFLIFGANKAGEFYGFAKMTGPITRTPPTRGHENSSTSESSSLLKSNMTIREDEAFQSPSVGLLSPNAPVVDSPQPATPAQATPGQSQPNSLDLRTNTLRKISTASAPAHISGALAPVPSRSLIHEVRKQMAEEEESIAERRGASLDIDLLTKGKDGIEGLSLRDKDNDKDDSKESTDVAELQQELGGHHEATPEADGDGVIRRDTALTVEERNQRLEALEERHSTDESKKSITSIFDKGWGRPFPVKWIKVQRLAFHRTKHLKNAFNQNREVKISRDGTELDPETGELLLTEFFREAPLESPYKDQFSSAGRF